MLFAAMTRGLSCSLVVNASITIDSIDSIAAWRKTIQESRIKQ
jgi:hypothetical protein